MSYSLDEKLDKNKELVNLNSHRQGMKVTLYQNHKYKPYIYDQQHLCVLKNRNHG